MRYPPGSSWRGQGGSGSQRASVQFPRFAPDGGVHPAFRPGARPPGWQYTPGRIGPGAPVPYAEPGPPVRIGPPTPYGPTGPFGRKPNVARAAPWVRRGRALLRLARVTPGGLLLGVLLDLGIQGIVQVATSGEGYDMTGWTHVCGPSGSPGGDYAGSALYYYWRSTNDSVSNCGLLGQAWTLSNVNRAPVTADRSLITGYRNEVLFANFGLSRFSHNEKWHRATSGTPPNQNVGRNAARLPQPLEVWPVEIPLPQPFWTPGGPIAPAPHPVPWRVAPLQPVAPPEAPRALPFRQAAYNITVGTVGPSVRTVEVSPETGTQPKTTQGNRNPQRVRVREKERKVKTNVPGVFGAIKAVAENALEFNDFIDALWGALPKSVRREAFIANGYRVLNPVQRAAVVARHFEEMDLRKAVCNVVRNEVTDRFWGQLGQYAGQAAARHGHAVGYGTLVASRRKGMLADHIGRAYRELTGSDMDGLDPAGTVFDAVFTICPDAPREIAARHLRRRNN